jgi:hypothetical protein
MYGDGWSTLLFNGMDARTYDLAMKTNATPMAAIYFVFFMILGNFFLNNLFVGSLIDSFKTESAKATGRIDDAGRLLLTEKQEQWIREFRFASASRIPVTPPALRNPVRRAFGWLYFVDESRTDARPAFENCITACIIANALAMCLQYRGMPSELGMFIYVCNVVFTAVFAVEFTIKIYALLPRAYWAQPWNRFDFLVLVCAVLSLLFTGPGTNAFKVAHVSRVLRLIPRAQGLYRLFESLVYSLPQLFNVTLVLTLIVYVFAMVGVSFFGALHVDNNDNQVLSEFFNFKNAGYAMILLFQIGTGEAWADVMSAGMMTPEVSDCSYAAGDCGNAVAIPYFIFFMLCCNSLALNLFIFIVVENYMDVHQIEDRKSQLLLFRLAGFRRLWSALDQENTGAITWRGFVVIARLMRVTRRAETQKFLAEWGYESLEEKSAIAAVGVRDDSDDEASPREGPSPKNGEDGGPQGTAAAEQDRDAALQAGHTSAIGSMNSTLRAEDDTAALRKLDSMLGFRPKFEDNLAEFGRGNDVMLMQQLINMDIPVTVGGDVQYLDCLYGIIKEFHGSLKAEEAAHGDDVCRFLGSVAGAPDAFKVHHELAVSKIIVMLRARKGGGRTAAEEEKLAELMRVERDKREHSAPACYQ